MLMKKDNGGWRILMILIVTTLLSTILASFAGATTTGTTIFFNIGAVADISVFDTSPPFNSSLESTDTIEIGANVTGPYTIDTVLAYITFPNTTTIVLNLTHSVGDRYNTSFTLPNITGPYNITYFANDSYSNKNDTETTQFTAIDTDTAPDVINILPLNASYDTNGKAVFRYRVNHTTTIDNCTLLINGTARATDTHINLHEVSIFNEDNLPGGTLLWNVLCIDNFGNTGTSENWTLYIDYPSGTDNETLIINETVQNAHGQFISATIELIDLGSGEIDVQTSSGELKNISAGVYDIKIRPLDLTIHEILIHNYTVTRNITEIMDLDNFTVTLYDFVNTYAIQPKISGYEYVNITVTAVTGDAFLCYEWDFANQNCTSNRWIKVADFPPGQNYTVQFGSGTVGFMESNYTINWIDATDGFVFNNQVQVKENGTRVDVEIVPFDSTIIKNITVRTHNKINISNDLKLGLTSNITGWPHNTLVDPTALDFGNFTVYKVANGTSLWKCYNYSDSQEICHEDLVYDRTLTPGTIYRLDITPLDPVFIEQPDDINGTDTFIYEGTPSTTYGTNTQMRINGESGNNSRAMLLWNISDLQPGLSITDARMELYKTSGEPNDLSIDAVRVTGDWPEDGIAWNNRSGYSSYIYDNVIVNDTDGWYLWNITGLVSEWYDSIEQNQGLYLKASTEDAGITNKVKRFWSSDYLADPSLRPKLTITIGPKVTLNTPAADTNIETEADASSITFNCSAKTNATLTSIALYITNSTGEAFALNSTTAITGTENSSSWTYDVSIGSYVWNCIVLDSEGKTDWGDLNRSLTISQYDVHPPINPGCSGCTPPDKPTCKEDWSCDEWTECFNGQESRTCEDVNSCGTWEYRPITKRNCYIPCDTEWKCTEWSECSASGTQERGCTDLQDCRIFRGMPETSRGCGYSHCNDRITNYDETGVDCGGSCPACEKARIIEIAETAESNILCTLHPLLVLILLLMIILTRGHTTPKNEKTVFAIANGTMATLLVIFMIPWFGFSQGICMAIADNMLLIDEIIVFLSGTFSIVLVEGIAYLILKKIYAEKGEVERSKPHSKRLYIILFVLTVLIAITTISLIFNTFFTKFIYPVEELGASTGLPLMVLYIPLLISLMTLAVILIRDLFNHLQPKTPLPQKKAESDVRISSARRHKQRNTPYQKAHLKTSPKLIKRRKKR
ncbi:MAG: DNRLRE domain-containing protein [Candidatus Woesearchaeota archaeon]